MRFALDDEAVRRRLGEFLVAASGARSVSIVSLARLGGGAIQENWSLEVDLVGGSRAGPQALVLRTDAPSRVAVSLGRAEEFAVLSVARDAGLTVPEPLWLCEDPAVIGRPFYVMERVPGEASGPRLVRSAALEEGGGDALVERLGRELARLHRVYPPHPQLAFLPEPDLPPALSRTLEYRLHLDRIPDPQPVLEWALRWLERHAPRRERLVLCHCDLRTGNFLVDGARLTGILDWEFAAWSDPLEDLGWLCAPCWRFGRRDREVGGIGHREALYAGYEAEGGEAVPRELVGYWELMATVRWAVVALQQGQRHLSGDEPSLELALTARLLPELELDILEQLDELRAEVAR